jgi:hypothetical protein
LAEKVRVNFRSSDDDDGGWDDENDEDEDGDGEEGLRLVERPVSKQVTKEPEIDEDGFTMVKGKAQQCMSPLLYASVMKYIGFNTAQCAHTWTSPIKFMNLFDGFLFAMLGIP